MANYEGMLAETVLINGHEGTQIDAYLARPLGAGPTGAVVLIHHMPGWDEASKEMARKLAYNGFATISPNLHFRQGQATPQDNSTSIRDAGGMPDDRTMGDVQAAIDYLRTLISRCSFPSASSVPTLVGVKKPPIPAPAQRIRSAKVPWGTNSASISPSAYSLAKGVTRDGWVGAVKAQIIFRI